MKPRNKGKRLKTTQGKAPPGVPETVVFDQAKEVRAIARERVGKVKPSQTIEPKGARKKPKHKKSLLEEQGPA
jgi:hypothetical protein